MNIFSQGKISVIKLASVKMENITIMKKLFFFTFPVTKFLHVNFLKTRLTFPIS